MPFAARYLTYHYCRELYSEDVSHGREIEGVTIIDLFP
jgi:hypothetical protein